MTKKTSRSVHLVFIDECGFMLMPVVTRTWAPRGQTPIMRVADPHGRISTIGAITISPVRTIFRFYYWLLPNNVNFNGNSIVTFVESLRCRIRQPFIILWDQIPIHQAHSMERYLTQHKDVMVALFPPYAPELNPVDYVWAYVKHSRLANFCPYNLEQLRMKVTSELSLVMTRPDLLKSFFAATKLEL